MTLTNALGHRTRWSPTYNSWRAMKMRCRQPTHPRYSSYGGRGIQVAAEFERFADFLAYMGERPEGTTIDRINVDGDYRPGNVRWATTAVQSSNRRETPARQHDDEMTEDSFRQWEAQQ